MEREVPDVALFPGPVPGQHADIIRPALHGLVEVDEPHVVALRQHDVLRVHVAVADVAEVHEPDGEAQLIPPRLKVGRVDLPVIDSRE